MSEKKPQFTLPSPESVAAMPNDNSDVEKNNNSESFFLSHRYRYFILVLGLFCLTMVNSNMVVYNFTVICFNDIPNATNDRPNIPTYNYTQNEKSMLVWAVAVGSIIGSPPFTYLTTKYGAKYVFFTAGILSIIGTVFTPMMMSFGLNYVLFMRILQGAAYSADFAAIGYMCVRWASLKQSAFYVSVLTCFSSMSTIVTNPLSALACNSSWGWPLAYYLHGIIAFLFFSAWLIFYKDDPQTHRSVSHVELEKIHRGKSDAHINLDSFIPYKAIFANKIILIVWFNALTDIASVVFLFFYIPTYLNKALHFNVASAGILGALPGMFHAPYRVFAGWASDKIKCIDERPKMIIANTLAVGIPAVTYIMLGFIPEGYPILAVAILTINVTAVGGNCGGFYKCGMFVSRQYSAFVIANIQFIKCVTLFIAPLLMTIFVQDESAKEGWQIIFFIMGGSLAFSHLLFCFVATDEPAEFTKITRKSASDAKLAKRSQVSSIHYH